MSKPTAATPVPARSTSRRVAWALGLVALYAALAALAMHQAGGAGMWAMLLGLPAPLVLGMLMLSIANYALRGWRWLYLSRRLHLPVPAGDNLLHYVAGYAFTATPGKAGEVLRLYLLKTGHQIGYLRSLPLMLADRVLDLWAVLLLALAGLWPMAQYRWQAGLLAVLVAAVSAPFILARRFEPLVSRLAGRAGKRRAVRARQALRALSDLACWRGYGVALWPSMLGWLAEGAALHLLLRHLGADVTLAQSVFVFSFGMIVGAISMLPGGLGSTEVAMVAMLGALGVGLDVAVLATTVVRLTTFWFAVLLGSIVLPVAWRRASRSAKASLRHAALG